MLLAIEFGGLVRGANREQQALDALEGAVGVVEREGVLMRPAVANVTTLVQERAIVRAQLAAKDLILLADYDADHRGGVPVAAAVATLTIAQMPPHGLISLVAVRALQVALEEGHQAGVEQLKCLADSFMIRYCMAASTEDYLLRRNALVFDLVP